MDDKLIIGKLATSNDHALLGKIIRIDKLMGKTIKKLKSYAIIEVRRFLKKNLSVPIDVEKIIEITKERVTFDLTHREFDEERLKIERITLEKTQYKEYPSGSWKDYQGGVRIPRRKGD